MSNVPKLRFKEFSGEWEKGTLKDFGTFYYGKSAPKSSVTKDATTPCVRYGELYGTYKEIIKEIKSYTNIDSDNLKLSKGGEILIPRVGENPLDFANCSYLPMSKVAIGEMISVYNTKENGLFFTFYINGMLKKQFAKVVEGGNVSNLYFRYLENIEVNIPIKQEQQKIASFLVTLSTKIEQLTKKESLLQYYKKGVMQKIFNQEIRFKADDGSEFCEWEKEKLNKYLVEYKNKSFYENEYPVLTSSNKGLMLQSDYFGENRLTERDNIGFNIVPSNFITYRSRSDNRTFTFNINTLGYTGIISTYYPVFECKNAENRFIVTLLNKNKHFIGKYSVGTSQTVLSFNELKNIRMFIPSLEEQTKIANFLSSIDKKIEVTKIELEKTKEFKKALLQQMFV